MKYFVLILAFGFLGFFLLGTNASYSQTDSFDEMNYSQFLDFCHRYNPALWDSISIEERLLSNLCDFVGKGFGEKQWSWLNGAKFDWKTFAQSAAEDYVDKIPEFVDGGIKETLRIDSFISSRDSFPPPMMAMMSFDYEKLSQVIHYNEKFTVCIDGKLVPQDSFIECSDEYVKYNFTKEEPSIIPKFVKPIPLPEYTRQQMLDWCQNSPKWAKIDKQFWDVVPTRILSTIPEFESLKGQTNSVEVHSYASEDTCPPNVWMAGTFISENGDKHKFSLYHDSDFFRYNIDKIQCKNGLVIVTKSIDGSPACVRPETKQKLIERGWAEPTKTKIKNSLLPPCTSDRTACFDQESNICDPSGWKCENREVFSKIIPLPEFNSYSTIFPYIWNDFVHRQRITFEPKEQSYINTDEGWYSGLNRVCSPIVSSNGTEFYISSVFVDEPFEIIGTFIDSTKPDDCHKIWKTEAVLPEPDRELAMWLENYHHDD